jgi:2-polyprenyl-6-methoxyphenol hydroxylase-like FAD-dependent oxidoreductase
MKIAIVGGGPAGLFFARLMKLRRPSDEIRVFEQNPVNATYGFGVTLAGPARGRLKQADADLHDRLAAEMWFNDEQDIVLQRERIHLKYAAKGGAIPRLTLLAVLEKACADVGIVTEHHTRITQSGELSGFDLVVGADGANSAVRALNPAPYGIRSRMLGNRFVWYGVRKPLRPNALVFREHNGGFYVGHYYAYSSEMSTFVAECDDRTWHECGLDRMSDEQRKELVEEIYAEELQGESLVENKSTWRTFNVTTSDNWTHGNTVLIGDALRVAHFSIGSGTRLAMDDAQALADAFGEAGGDVPKALALFVEARKPTRDMFSEAMIRSFEWYENFRQAMQTDAVSFAKAFLTRTGRVDEKRLKEYVPEFYRKYLAPKAEMAAFHGK